MSPFRFMMVEAKLSFVQLGFFWFCFFIFFFFFFLFYFSTTCTNEERCLLMVSFSLGFCSSRELAPSRSSEGESDLNSAGVYTKASRVAFVCGLFLCPLLTTVVRWFLVSPAVTFFLVFLQSCKVDDRQRTA